MSSNNQKRFFLRATVVALAVLASPSVFALNGKTFYHYIAYEAAFWPSGQPATAALYPTQELNALAALPFDTLVFDPEFDFGSMAGILKNATYPKHQPDPKRFYGRKDWKNAMPEFVKAGVDPIAETVKWCRSHKKEAVVAMALNFRCTHSARPTPEYPVSSWRSYLWSDFKTANPTCLMAPTKDDSAAFGGRDFVDYGDAKVRDKYAAIACEILGKYDVDGFMADFMLFPTLFRSVATGGTAAPKEVLLMTEMMQRIKAACKAASTRLGHPVVFMARVPDSVAYCKDMGVDLQGWFDTKLLDAVVLGGRFQLNRWNVTGDLANKAGIPFYASFDQSGIYVGNDSGYSGDDERTPRHNPNAIRARMADALLCKAAGCMYSQGTHWELWPGRGAVLPFDAKENRLADKRYFISFANDGLAGSYLKEGVKHRTIGSLISSSPIDLSKGLVKKSIDVWEDFPALKKEGVSPKVTLITEVSIPSGIETEVTFNGKPVKAFKKRSGTQLYDVSGSVRFGANEMSIKAKGKNKRGQTAKFGNVVVEVAYPKVDAKKEGGK